MRFSGGSSGAIDFQHDDLTLPSLHTLIFIDTAWMNIRNLEIFLLGLQPPIRKLYLNQCFNLTSHEFAQILMASRERNPELNQLEEFGFSQSREVDDSFASMFRVVFPRLKVLDLSFTNITGCTIRRLAEHRCSQRNTGAKLDRLIVRGCERVSSDAIQWGRGTGLEIVT